MHPPAVRNERPVSHISYNSVGPIVPFRDYWLELVTSPSSTASSLCSMNLHVRPCPCPFQCITSEAFRRIFLQANIDFSDVLAKKMNYVLRSSHFVEECCRIQKNGKHFTNICSLRIWIIQISGFGLGSWAAATATSTVSLLGYKSSYSMSTDALFQILQLFTYLDTIYSLT